MSKKSKSNNNGSQPQTTNDTAETAYAQQSGSAQNANHTKRKK